MNKKRIAVGLMGMSLLVGSGLLAKETARAHYQQGYTRQRFEQADKDHDGFLTLEEASAAIKEFEGVKGRRRFDEADANKDGQLSLEEAATRKAYEEKHARDYAKGQHDEKYSADRFHEADTNGDGLLSREEVRQNRLVNEKFGGNRRFKLADKNHDGFLSLEECAAQRKDERRHF